jgi:hypothetical protein
LHQDGSLYMCGHSTAIGPKGWGTDMRIRIIQFSLKAVVAVGIALLGVNAIGGRVAYSAVERAWAAGKEMLAKPLRPPGTEDGVSAQRLSKAPDDDVGQIELQVFIDPYLAKLNAKQRGCRCAHG